MVFNFVTHRENLKRKQNGGHFTAPHRDCVVLRFLLKTTLNVWQRRVTEKKHVRHHHRPLMYDFRLHFMQKWDSTRNCSGNGMKLLNES